MKFYESQRHGRKQLVVPAGQRARVAEAFEAEHANALTARPLEPLKPRDANKPQRIINIVDQNGTITGRALHQDIVNSLLVREGYELARVEGKRPVAIRCIEPGCLKMRRVGNRGSLPKRCLEHQEQEVTRRFQEVKTANKRRPETARRRERERERRKRQKMSPEKRREKNRRKEARRRLKKREAP